MHLRSLPDFPVFSFIRDSISIHSGKKSKVRKNRALIHRRHYCHRLDMPSLSRECTIFCISPDFGLLHRNTFTQFTYLSYSSIWPWFDFNAPRQKVRNPEE